MNNLSELEKLKKFGDKKRVTASTKMNEHSSRSHSIFSITIETIDNNTTNIQQQQQQPKGDKKLSKLNKNPRVVSTSSIKVGRLNLIDLAGSERQAKSGSVGARLKEASRINLSLTCLSLVIRALTDKSSTHIPYRNSKLTRLLSSSLGGNSKTLLIACISSERAHVDETLSTLRFASRTKKIKNTAKINEDSKDALLRKYRKQIEELRLKLQVHTKNKSDKQPQKQTDLTNVPSNYTEDEAIESLKQQQPISTDEQQKQEILLKQLCLLKDKIMIGGENLLEKVEMHEKLLEASRQELEEKRLEEVRLREKLEAKTENIKRMAITKGSLESQVIDLDEKLNQVLLIYKRTKEEHRDLISEHESLKESLLQTIRATSKEIKYADCIIDDFIPSKLSHLCLIYYFNRVSSKLTLFYTILYLCLGEHLDLINAYAQYDDESDEWQIKFIALSGNNIAQTRRIAEVGQATSSTQDMEEASTSHSFNDQASYLQSQAVYKQDPFLKLRDLGK